MERGDSTCNSGLWDLPDDERAEIMDQACDQNDTEHFYDLEPEERARAYEKAEGEVR